LLFNHQLPVSHCCRQDRLQPGESVVQQCTTNDDATPAPTCPTGNAAWLSPDDERVSSAGECHGESDGVQLYGAALAAGGA